MPKKSVSQIHPYKVKLTIGQKAADKITEFCGSWTFIFALFIFMIGWIALNSLAWSKHWDPYPFILLNFVLSCLAAIQAPIILMSQNRQAQRDRLRFEYDYAINRKAEREIRDVQGDLEEIKAQLRKVLARLHSK